MRPAHKNIAIAYLRPFLASTMIAGGLFQLAEPTYAAGTTGGADITNTATASYEDPNQPGTSLNTISNTVTIKVDKIAGVVVTGEGSTDVTPATPNNAPGDIVNFNFQITNKGNTATKFSIPGLATVSPSGTFQKVQWLTPGANPLLDASWNDVPTGGATDPASMPVVPVDGFIKARVVVKINATAATGDPLTVILGKTNQTPDATTPSVGNVQRTASPENADTGDVYTIDITDGTTIDPSTNTPVPAGPAVNSTRESAAIVSAVVNKDKKTFADITMTGSAPVADPNAPNDVTKDKITYDIKVKVDPVSPDPNVNPSDLGATPLTLDGNPENRVLISDPLPAGTVPTSLVAPTGWTPVYSISPAGTPIDQVEWKTGTPPTDGTVKFVGFVKNDPLPLPMSATPYDGFKVVVQTTGASTTTPTTFSNTADVFGTTPKADNTPDTTKPVHDQTGTATPNTPTGGTPVVATVTPIAANGLSLLNGPKDQPAAAGPDGTQNTDFTNKSAEIKPSDATVTDPVTGALAPLATPLPAAFNNTVKNNGTVPTDIYIVPTPPAVATDLPTGTKVTISYGGDTRTYIYNSGSGAFTPTDTTKLPIVIPAVAVNASPAYGVAVTLPPNTPQLTGYSVPVTTFADTTPPVAGATTIPGTAAKNTTIDTVYTGFINLKKDARILDSAADANLPDSGATAFSAGTLTAKPKPGQFIQYRIKYNNITPANGTSGNNNGLLNASGLNILEDGTLAPNNWAASTTHAPNSASDSKGGTITFSPVNSNADTTVTKYEVKETVNIAPGESGSFTFLRAVK